MGAGSPEWGLVLSGGGARGAYQVGCFRAFRELGLDFPIVAGTSVGAAAALARPGKLQTATRWLRVVAALLILAGGVWLFTH